MDSSFSEFSSDALQPRHCGHLRQAGQRSSGVYTIYHKAANKSGELVYCDMEMDGGGWTVRPHSVGHRHDQLSQFI
ncbi:hypothetical protein HPB48_002388 [Haemaphysalis longicornis]|uniref:Fibrinogen C-terminal domain-containing protein n=1 Tax=Haemaphysalis longicornis TaxID=44386 RepID=A0A9J6GNW4_HAELO|nr:hypothetical protein HPB48_002388 [Haemaphysalis longicornis]